MNYTLDSGHLQTYSVPLYVNVTVADGLCSSISFSFDVAAGAEAVAKMDSESGSA